MNQLITEWVVDCDQPFDKVEKPEFNRMLYYAHQDELKIPGRNAVKRRVMKMGEDVVEETRQMFLVCGHFTWIQSWSLH
jgi:hypothetical protein